MMRRAAALLLFAVILRADPAEDVKDVIRKAVSALTERNAAALWLLFDPKMPGYAALRKDSQALLAVADASSTVDFLKNEGDDRARTLQLNWSMQINETQRGVSTTTRQAQVTCKLERKADAWKITSFTPADFFAPTRAGQVWDVISDAAIALNSPDRERPTPVDTAAFLSAFDPKMPGFPDLAENVTGLTRRGPIECAVELLTNQGTDQQRTVEVDWSLQVVDAQSSISVLNRDQHLTLKLDFQGKHWKIVGLSSVDFFKP